jgi:hypothetical protein
VLCFEMPKKHRKGKRQVVPAVGWNPPQYRAINIFRRKFRFYVSTGFGSGTLSESELLCMPGTMCTVANATVVAMAISVRLRSLEIWGVAQNTGSTSQVSIMPLAVGAAAANNLAVLEMVSDVSSNASYTPHCKYIPRKGSRMDFWLTADNSGADEILRIEAPAGSIVEFDLEFNHGMPPSIGSFTRAVASGSLGTMYWLGFNAVSGTGQMFPTDLATTI